MEGKKSKDNPEQSRRFEETARQLGVDESGNKFKAAMKVIAKKKNVRGHAKSLPPK